MDVFSGASLAEPNPEGCQKVAGGCSGQEGNDHRKTAFVSSAPRRGARSISHVLHLGLSMLCSDVWYPCRGAGLLLCAVCPEVATPRKPRRPPEFQLSLAREVAAYFTGPLFSFCMKVDLSTFSTGDFDRGASRIRELLWLLVRLLLFQLCPLKCSALKCWTLRRFGARVGRGVVIKPDVKITFPWKLTVGDHVWLGEECWLLNLAPITIESNVCISQRAFLCTGNHDYKSPAFDLITRPIRVERGAWIGSGAFVGPGVTVGTHAVLTAGSVATKDLQPWGIYQGNPAVLVKERVLREMPKP